MSKRTEGEMLKLLRVKYGETAGNGSAYAVMPQVRSAAGFDARRTLDAVVMSLWPSRGLFLEGFEVKCDRRDWQRELKAPEKAEEFVRLLDRFWIVAADADIIQPGELPEDWGLMVPRGTGLGVVKEAPLLAPGHPEGRQRARPLPEHFNRSFLAALLRAATYVGAAKPEEIVAAEARGKKAAEERLTFRLEDAETALEQLTAKVHAFEEAAGVSLTWRHGEMTPDAIGAALRALINGEADLERRLDRLRMLARTAALLAEDLARDVAYLEVTDA